MNAATVIALIRARFRRRPTEEQRVAAARKRVGLLPGPGLPDEHNVGPDSLRLLEDADLHLNQCAAADARLWGAFAPGAPIPDLTTHPDFDAGYDRLRDAIREHREEDQA